MGQPIAPSLRLEIVKSRQEEKLSYRDLAARFKVNYHTARNLCLSYEKRGEAALVPGYSNCGRGVKPEAEKAYRLVRLI
ncbi:MAG: helix-turn-helix domain-containing protein [Lewinellaceae bacterium]|nr:helix-turn-helix domain-containing protein [Lewinellaceae bacterium]